MGGIGSLALNANSEEIRAKIERAVTVAIECLRRDTLMVSRPDRGDGETITLDEAQKIIEAYKELERYVNEPWNEVARAGKVPVSAETRFEGDVVIFTYTPSYTEADPVEDKYPIALFFDPVVPANVLIAAELKKRYEAKQAREKAAIKERERTYRDSEMAELDRLKKKYPGA